MLPRYHALRPLYYLLLGVLAGQAILLLTLLHQTHWLSVLSGAIIVATFVAAWDGIALMIPNLLKQHDQEAEVAQRAILSGEREAAVGRMVAGVTHEINNPLEALGNLLYLSNTDCGPDSRRRFLGQAKEEVDRIGHITRSGLGMFRDSSTPCNVDLASLSDEVLKLFHKDINLKGLTVTREFHDGIAEAHPGEIRQVLANLLRNAVEAAPERGTVSLHSESTDQEAVVSIQDNGPGIPAAIQEHLFEPFFTTKGENGTGVGLWISRRLVDKNGGRIGVLTGHTGTTFEVHLPRHRHCA